MDRIEDFKKYIIDYEISHYINKLEINDMEELIESLDEKYYKPYFKWVNNKSKAYIYKLHNELINTYVQSSEYYEMKMWNNQKFFNNISIEIEKEDFNYAIMNFMEFDTIDLYFIIKEPFGIFLKAKKDSDIYSKKVLKEIESAIDKFFEEKIKDENQEKRDVLLKKGIYEKVVYGIFLILLEKGKGKIQINQKGYNLYYSEFVKSQLEKSREVESIKKRVDNIYENIATIMGLLITAFSIIGFNVYSLGASISTAGIIILNISLVFALSFLVWLLDTIVYKSGREIWYAPFLSGILLAGVALSFAQAGYIK